jgi:hypothetical protein
VLFTRKLAKLVSHFFNILRISTDFTSFRQNTNKRKNLFALRSLEFFEFHNNTLDFYSKVPARVQSAYRDPRRRMGARRRRWVTGVGRQAAREGDWDHRGAIGGSSGLGDNADEPWRRGSGGGGRYGSKSGETMSRAGQVVSVVALGGPKEGVRSAGWWRERVGKGARLGGSNGARCSREEGTTLLL